MRRDPQQVHREEGTATIIPPEPLDEEALRKAIAETGYEVKSVESKPYEKHGLFHR